MSKRLEGGFLTARPTWSTAATPGVWAPEQHFARVYASGWPSPTALFDPYFESVSLLLHMDGSNGSTTFVDSSLGNLAVTANGNAQISTAQSKFGGSSGAFDGVGDFLQLSGQSGFAFGTGDFTIELWAYFNNFTNAVNVYESRQTTEANRPAIVIGTSASVSYYDGSSFAINSSAGVLTTGQWFHIAVARSNGSTRLFVNGTQVGATYSDTLNYGIGANRPVIGTYDGAQGNVNGYIDELRVTKGVARYTANFVVPGVGSDEGAALYDPYFDYVSLLLRCNGDNNSTTFTDSSNNALTVTGNGNAKISTAQARFGGASAYFDGTGDNLRPALSTGFDFGTGDFTIEAWSFITASTLSYPIIFQLVYGSKVVTLRYGDSGFAYKLQIGIDASVLSGVYSCSTTQAACLNKWVHTAFTRVGGVCRLYVNGVRQDLGSGANPLTYPSSSFTDSSSITSVSLVQVGDNFAGYIDDLRITKGVARYTTDFRPVGPYATSGKLVDPYLTSTSLLLPMTGDNGNTSFFDRSNNFLRATEYGNAKVSTAISKFGAGAAYFDGTGDYLSYPNDSRYDFGTGDFTVEAWVYIAGNSTANSSGTRFAVVVSNVGQSGGLVPGWTLEITGDGSTTGTGFGFEYWNSSSYSVYATVAIAQQAWHHVAVVRSGTVTTVYLNGVARASGTLGNQNITSTQPLLIGRKNVSGYLHELNGYIDDLRITKGTARYTSAFTPPERAFNDEAFNDPDYNAVSLLLHMDGTNNSTTFTDSSVNGLTVTANGNAQISTAQSKFGGASGYFDGTGDFLSLSNSSLFGFSTGDFTVEAWVKTNTNPAVIFDNRTTSEAGSFYLASTTGRIGYYDPTAGAIVGSTTNCSDNSWHHLAWSRSNTTMRLFVDGVQEASGTVSSSFGSSRPARIGFEYLNTAAINGYIDDFRITKGVARYTSNFTPPTLPFYNTTIPTVDPSFSSVSLLLHMDGSNGSTTFTDSSSNALAVTANGNAQISTAQSKFGGASGAFDGNGDYLSLANLSSLYLGASDFTFEMWVYPLSADAGEFLFWNANSNAFGLRLVISASQLGFLATLDGASHAINASAGTINANQWTHISIARSGTSISVFVNGVATYTNTSFSGVMNSGSLNIIGGRTAFPNYFNGYIDDLRITKGVCRYTSNFYIPRAAFPDA